LGRSKRGRAVSCAEACTSSILLSRPQQGAMVCAWVSGLTVGGSAATAAKPTASAAAAG
jgi:hypothetical protein